MAIKLPSSKRELTSSAIWILVSVIFLDVSRGKVVDLQAAGQYVSPWRYAEAAFWVSILMFWIWNGWKSWLRYQADKG
jgi:hypothetical protein